jgi:hypothetical protein
MEIGVELMRFEALRCEGFHSRGDTLEDNPLILGKAVALARLRAHANAPKTDFFMVPLTAASLNGIREAD